MPRATRSAAKASASDSKPYSRDSTPATKAGLQGRNQEAGSTKKAKPRTGKDSHLYTDDNPKTTLHGTGFKDAETATRTIELVSKRSLLYQFQTINTMYNRAKHHPRSQGNDSIQAAMAIFKTWLDETYPAEKAKQIAFPLLKKEVVDLYLSRIREQAERLNVDVTWAEKYVGLDKGKRLANVLMDDEQPGEPDMARVRQDELERIIEDRDGVVPKKGDRELWDEHGTGASESHLRMIAYAFSPVKAEVLEQAFEKSQR